ncbi:MAG TPA: hypothetical protein VGS57_03230 [Thermoanaerobaculia bacterium]|nr:hypothetical protein [Thermoanaerobaculia bacterium]
MTAYPIVVECAAGEVRRLHSANWSEPNNMTNAPRPRIRPAMKLRLTARRKDMPASRARAFAALAMLTAALFCAAPAAAVEVWHSAPLWGGDVTSLAFAPADANIAVAGTAAGNVYVSHDAGATWAPAGATFPMPGWVVTSLQFDPNRPTRLWAALRGVFGGGAVVRSDDLGRSWETRSQRPDDVVFSLALVPGEDGRLFLGTRSGVWGSTDGGTNWKKLSGGQPELVEVWSLLVHPLHPQTVLAGTYRRAFRSDDGGVTWRGVFEGMVLDSQVFTLNPVPGQPDQVWASTCGWVYKSDDLGERWTRMREGLFERRTPGFTALPSGRLLAGTVSGIYVSDNAGNSWARRTRDDLSALVVAYHPKHPEVVLVGTEGAGVWRSTDGGSSFFPSTHGIAAARVSALAKSRGEVLASVAHGGPIAGIYGVLDGGERAVHELAQIPTVLSLATAGDDAWAATEGGLFARRDGIWQRLPELPATRVEQVVAAEGRVLARTPDATFERRDGRFVPIAGTAAGAGAAAAPPRELLTAAALGSRWRDLAHGKRRVLATGDAQYPAVLIDDQGAHLLVAADRALRPLALPIPPRDVLAAVVDQGRLLLGTSGYGLLYAPLAELVPSAAGGATAVAGQ